MDNNQQPHSNLLHDLPLLPSWPIHPTPPKPTHLQAARVKTSPVDVIRATHTLVTVWSWSAPSVEPPHTWTPNAGQPQGLVTSSPSLYLTFAPTLPHLAGSSCSLPPLSEGCCLLLAVSSHRSFLCGSVSDDMSLLFIQVSHSRIFIANR